MKAFAFHLLTILIYIHSCRCDYDYAATVDYYENLINRNTQAALHSNLPTSAAEFRPYNPNAAVTNFGQFDFIVIGSGSAGAVIASRLSEVPQWQVLLIEAGDQYDDFAEIPGMHSYLQGLSTNWNYNSTTQTSSCLGMINRRCPIPRGKVFGGTSTINGLVYCRGNKADYDEWARDGNDGWSYNDVLPYFIKSENAQVDGDPNYHGKGGNWNVKYHYLPSPQMDALVRASRNTFNLTSNDYNGESQLGMFYGQLSNIRQFRHNTAKAFITPYLDRPNLKVLLKGYVTKILIDQRNAYGVQFTYTSRSYQAFATKEVIVSAGSIGSPQLLMLSGIGPQNDLRRLRIPVIINLPVGGELYDHPMFFGLFVSTNHTEPAKSVRENVKDFLADQGLYTIALNSQGVGFYQSCYATTQGLPDIELEVVPSISTNSFTKRSFKFTDQTYNAFIKGINPQNSFNVYIINLKPKSVGSLKLASADPYTYPLIDLNMLSHPQDVEVLYQGVQVLQRLLRTPELRQLNAKIIVQDYPQCRNNKKGSKAYWICAFRLLTSTVYHPMGTCRMGPDPRSSVVDNELKVHGIRGLRVADASIIPHPIAGHTNAPAVLIGEKISDKIKCEHGQPIENIVNAFGQNS